MKSNLSAFLDDELEGHQQERVLAAMAGDEALRQTWDSYHLIGDALRRVPALDRRLTPRVMERLQSEPALLAPRGRRSEHPVRALLALAATAAGVALVAWVALGPQRPVPTPPTALRNPPAPAASAPAGGRLQEYMVAHQAYSPANRILGGTAYVRAVSAAGGAR